MKILPISLVVISAVATAIATGARPAAAAYPTFAIDWSTVSSSVFTSYTPGQTATITGNTTGSVVAPFTATINFLSSNTTDRFSLDRNTQGNTPNSLLLKMGDGTNASTRSSSQHVTVTISVSGTFAQLVSTDFSLLDVDTGGNGANWVDQVQVTTSGATLTPANTATTSVSGQTVTATTTAAAVASTATEGNVDVFFAPGSKNFSFDYRNAPGGSLAGSQQIVGFSNVVFTVVPEANSATLLGLALPLVGTVAVMRRRKK